MSEFQAAIRRGDGFAMNTVTLLLRERRGYDAAAYLMADGTWRDAAPGVALDRDVGIQLPAGAIEAIAVAIQEFQGHTSHADTEARVLREWLTVERERVDRALRGDSRK